MTNDTFKVEHRYLDLPDSFYSRVNPTPLSGPKVTCFNHKLAAQLGFHVQDEQDWAQIGAGAELLEGMDPVAMKYTGRSEEHTSELQSRPHIVCRLLLEKKKYAVFCLKKKRKKHETKK